MSPEIALILYTLVLCTLCVSLYHWGLNSFAAITLSLVVGFIVLMIIYPPGSFDPWAVAESTAALYALIFGVTPVIVTIYAIYSGIHDLR